MLRSRHTRYILILLFACVLAALVFPVAHWRNSRFTRFTGQPLPDGSRITFLYPSYLPDVEEGGGGPDLIETVSVLDRGGEQPWDVNRTPWGGWARQLGITHAEHVTVIVAPLKEKNLEDSRSSVRSVQGWAQGRSETLIDATRKLRIQLMYSCAKDAGQFEQHSRTIADSLQLLPPK